MHFDDAAIVVQHRGRARGDGGRVVLESEVVLAEAIVGRGTLAVGARLGAGLGKVHGARKVLDREAILMQRRTRHAHVVEAVAVVGRENERLLEAIDGFGVAADAVEHEALLVERGRAGAVERVRLGGVLERLGKELEPRHAHRAAEIRAAVRWIEQQGASKVHQRLAVSIETRAAHGAAVVRARIRRVDADRLRVRAPRFMKCSSKVLGIGFLIELDSLSSTHDSERDREREG